MIRRLFIVLSAVSLVLCVAAVVLWVRSDTYTDCLKLQIAAGRPTAATASPFTLAQVDELRRQMGWPAIY